MIKDIKSTEHNGESITYWRSIENRRRTEDYLASIENEFLGDLSEITSVDRRSMLKVMGASMALAGLGASCRRPEDKILPYVKQPENIIPGIANFYATAQPTPFGAQGILVESHEGRPTKVEGNPSHPSSMGRASIINQAAALEIYDPDRSRFCVREDGSVRTMVSWDDFDSFCAEHFFELRKSSGQGLAIVTDADLSPTFLRLKNRVKSLFPKGRFFVHEPMRQRNVEMANQQAFSRPCRIRYNLDNAKVIASIFCDPFSFGPDHIRHMSGYSKNRTVYGKDDVKNMSRFYAVEADFTLAGTNADHRLRLPVGLASNLIRALAYELHATNGIDVPANMDKVISLSKLISRPPSYKGLDKRFVIAMAQDLAKGRGQALIMGGDHLPPAALSLIHAINVALGGLNKTFEILAIDDENAIEHLAEPDIGALATALKRDEIASVVFLGVNPLYDAPGHLELRDLIKKARVSIHCHQTEDETGSDCSWHVPQSHFLEHFGDARSFDGHVSIIQPLIKPLHNSRSIIQLLAQMAGMEHQDGLKLVKDTHRGRFGAKGFAKGFDRAVHDGVIADSGFKRVQEPSLDCAGIYSEFNKLSSRAPNKENFELVLSFDRRVLDGRYANHSWLEELPDPITKLTWGNALLMSPAAAKQYGIKSGVKKNAYVADVVKVTAGERSVELPAFVMPGLPDHTLVASLGYGRVKAGEVGNGVGVDLYHLLRDHSSMVHHGVKLERLAQTIRLSSTQEQFAMNGDTVQEIDVLSMQNRNPARATDVPDYLKNPAGAKNVGLTENLLVDEAKSQKRVPLQLTEAWDYRKGNQWGMVIDLAKCTGCNACVIACQSENNIPVVGKEQVIRGRLMHWLRVDRYFVGDVNSPRAVSQPVPCQHCENAPCEPVCPVAATSHDSEGLNVMTYNRCIGTRYCANNCPYKVRHFNYFDFTHSGNMHVDEKIKARQKTLKLQRNPDVTVRYRGVMEKCNYCTQRIQEAKMAARRQRIDQNELPDGSVTPACAQTCPADAIVFGRINDETSRVSALKNVDRHYTMLDVLNTRARTGYLSRLRNPNPDLVA